MVYVGKIRVLILLSFFYISFIARSARVLVRHIQKRAIIYFFLLQVILIYKKNFNEEKDMFLCDKKIWHESSELEVQLSTLWFKLEDIF